jgi:hypothetical protein
LTQFGTARIPCDSPSQRLAHSSAVTYYGKPGPINLGFLLMRNAG